MVGAGAAVGHDGEVSTPPVPPSPAFPSRPWTLLTNHGRILLLIARHPDARVRDLADRAGITERAAQTIVGDLENAGYLTRVREGRRNTYVVHADQPFRHPAESDHHISELLDVFGQDPDPTPAP